MLPQPQDLSINIPKFQTKCHSDMLTIQNSVKLQNLNSQLANQSLTFLAQKHLQHIQSIIFNYKHELSGACAMSQLAILQLSFIHFRISHIEKEKKKASLHFIYVKCFPFFSHADNYYDFLKSREAITRNEQM